MRSSKNCGSSRIKISTIEVSFVDECFQIPTIEKFNGTVTMIRRVCRITHTIMLAICAISDRQNFPKGRRVNSEWKDSKYFFCKCFVKGRSPPFFLSLSSIFLETFLSNNVLFIYIKALDRVTAQLHISRRSGYHESTGPTSVASLQS